MRLMLLLILSALIACNESDVEIKQQKPTLFSNDPFYKANIDTFSFYDNGMHYRMYYGRMSGYTRGTTMYIVNITLDSLKLQEYMIYTNKFVTRYRISQIGHAISDSSKYYDSITTYYLKKGNYNKDSFFRYQNLYCKSRNHQHKLYDKNETPINNLRIAAGITEQ